MLKLKSNNLDPDAAKLKSDECKSVLTFGFDIESKEKTTPLLRKELNTEIQKGKSTAKFWIAVEAIQAPEGTEESRNAKRVKLD